MGMKFNVRPTDCKFVVNEEKKTVVCIYEGCQYTFIDFVEANCRFQPFYCVRNGQEPLDLLYQKCFMPNRFIGVAKCGENDEWDEKTGRLIAFSRMKDNLNRSFFKRANTFFNTMDKWLDDAAALVNEIGEKLEVNQERRHKHIEDLIGTEE